MEMQIEFFDKNFDERNPKLLMDHVPRMASIEAPFLPTTLSLVYGKLLRKAIPQPVASGSGAGKAPKSENQIAAELTPAPAPRIRKELLKCERCGERVKLQDLSNGLYCPSSSCPGRTEPLVINYTFLFRSQMLCPSCNWHRDKMSNVCLGLGCQVKFM